MLLFDWILNECAGIFYIGHRCTQKHNTLSSNGINMQVHVPLCKLWQFRNTILGTGKSLYVTKVIIVFIKHSILIVLYQLGHPLSFPHFIINNDKKCSLKTEIKKYIRKINVMRDTFILGLKQYCTIQYHRQKLVQVHIMQSSLYTLQLEMEMLNRLYNYTSTYLVLYCFQFLHN